MEDPLLDEFVFLTLTNKRHENAAAAIFCPRVQPVFQNFLLKDIICLPSRVHEFLIYPQNGCTIKNLLDIVREVNNTSGFSKRLSFPGMFIALIKSVIFTLHIKNRSEKHRFYILKNNCSKRCGSRELCLFNA